MGSAPESPAESMVSLKRLRIFDPLQSPTMSSANTPTKLSRPLADLSESKAKSAIGNSSKPTLEDMHQQRVQLQEMQHRSIVAAPSRIRDLKLTTSDCQHAQELFQHQLWVRHQQLAELKPEQNRYDGDVREFAYNSAHEVDRSGEISRHKHQHLEGGGK